MTIILKITAATISVLVFCWIVVIVIRRVATPIDDHLNVITLQNRCVAVDETASQRENQCTHTGARHESKDSVVYSASLEERFDGLE